MITSAAPKPVRSQKLLKSLVWPGAIMLLAGGLLGHPPASAAQEGPKVATIEVEAEGEVLATPDIASLVLAVETQAPQAEEARAANAKASEALLKAMTGLLKPEKKFRA